MILAIDLGNAFLYTAEEFSRYVYKHRICDENHEFDLLKIKQALDFLGFESNSVEFEELLKKKIKNQKNRLKKKRQQM